MMSTSSNPFHTLEYRYEPPTFDQEFPMDFIDEFFASLNQEHEPFESYIEEINPNSSSPLGVNDSHSSSSSSLSSQMDAEQPVATSTNSPETVSPPLNLTCAVCGVPAHGYNFDQITCESCKAFFRRNALRNSANLKCRFSGNCVINAQTRRLCTYCRLKKCFDVNMKKEWIRTDEERRARELIKLTKQQRKLHKLPPSALPIPAVPIVVRKKKRLGLHSNKSNQQKPSPEKKETTIATIQHFSMYRDLSLEDQTILNNISNAYKIGADAADLSHLGQYNGSSSLLQFLNNESRNHQSLILYYKNLPQFSQRQLQDKILLIKSNMINLIHLHHIIVQNFQEHPRIGAHMSQWVGEDFHRDMSLTRKRFDRFMNYPLVIKLALAVLIFSTNLSNPRPNSDDVYYTDPKSIHDCQNFHVSILWKYLNYLFSEDEARRSMQTIVMQILRYQMLMSRMEDQLLNATVQDRLNELMRSIFRVV